MIYNLFNPAPEDSDLDVYSEKFYLEIGFFFKHVTNTNLPETGEGQVGIGLTHPHNHETKCFLSILAWGKYLIAYIGIPFILKC